MAAIVSRTYSGSPQKCLQLENNIARRTLEIGATWVQLRIGILAAISHSGADANHTNEFWFGLASSTSGGNVPGGPSVQHFAGIEFPSGTFSWTSGDPSYGTTANGRYFANNSSLYDSVASSFVDIGVAGTNRLPVFIDFERDDSGSYYLRFSDKTATYPDMTESEFDNIMANAGTFRGTLSGATAPGSDQAFDSTADVNANIASYGDFDTLVMYGGTATGRIEIERVAVARFS